MRLYLKTGPLTGDSLKTRSLEWTLIPYDRCPSKKRLGYRHTQREACVRAPGDTVSTRQGQRPEEEPGDRTSSLQEREAETPVAKAARLWHHRARADACLQSPVIRRREDHSGSRVKHSPIHSEFT